MFGKHFTIYVSAATKKNKGSMIDFEENTQQPGVVSVVNTSESVNTLRFVLSLPDAVKDYSKSIYSPNYFF